MLEPETRSRRKPVRDIKPFEIVGRVEAVLVTSAAGQVTSETYGSGSLETAQVEKIRVIVGEGVHGDRHAGQRRFVDVREKELRAFGFWKGIEMANHRQFSAVSLEDLQYVGGTLELPGPIPYGCLGENLVLSGIPSLSLLPSSSLIFFKKGKIPRSAVLAVWEENTPCRGPGQALEKRFPGCGDLATAFPKVAVGKRGIVGSVYSSGEIGTGDEVLVKVPHQRFYNNW
jgi:hypothetical protein